MASRSSFTSTASVPRRQLAMENVTGWNYCDRCKDIKTPNWKCVICEDVLCDNCKKEHTETAKYKTHRVISYEDRDKEVNSKSNLYCKEHQTNKIIMYCETCQIPVCEECIETRHSKHDLLTIKRFVEKKRKQLISDARDKVKLFQEKKFEKTLECLDKIDACNAKAAKELLTKVLNEVSEIMNKEIHRECDNVSTKRQNMIHKMQEIQSDLSKYEETLNADDDYVHCYIAHNSNEKAIQFNLDIPEGFLEVPPALNMTDDMVLNITEAFREKFETLESKERRVHKAEDVRNRLQKEVEELTSSKDEFKMEKNEYEKEKLEGQQIRQDLEIMIRKANEDRKQYQKLLDELKSKVYY